MLDKRKMLCDRCKGSVPVVDVKYVMSGTKMLALCSDCRGQQNVANPKPIVKEQSPIVVPKEQSAVASGKKTYFCERCKYEFRHDPKGVTNLVCPYCGKVDRVVPESKRAAHKLLNNMLD